MTLSKLTRIDRELARLDLATTPRRQRIRLAWARSSLTSYSPSSLTVGSLLNALKEMLAGWIEEPTLPSRSPFLNRPRLTPPTLPPPGSYRPARYFSKGALDRDPKKNPAPIPYLLTETEENAQARPVPGSSLLLRSLCKGKGVLKRNASGMIYLDIDNRFITTMIPYLKAHGLVRPPYFNLFGPFPEGAHIPIITSREARFHFIDQVGELGKTFSFEIEGLYSLEPTLWPEVEQVWIFKLRSPELETLRRRHFLTATPGCHSFHIVVAVKARAGLGKKGHPHPVMRINIAYLAA